MKSNYINNQKNIQKDRKKKEWKKKERKKYKLTCVVSGLKYFGSVDTFINFNEIRFKRSLPSL